MSKKIIIHILPIDCPPTTAAVLLRGIGELSWIGHGYRLSLKKIHDDDGATFLGFQVNEHYFKNSAMNFSKSSSKR